MNPETKLLLDELDKRFAAADKRFDGLERQIQSNNNSASSRILALEQSTLVFDEWRPRIEGVVDDLKIEIGKLSSLKMEVGKITKYWERSMVDTATLAPGVFASVPPSPSAVITDLNSVDDPKSTFANDFQATPRSYAGVAADRPQAPRRTSEPGW